MKKILAITASLILIAGLAACLAVGLAAHSEIDSSSEASRSDSSVTDTHSSNDSSYSVDDTQDGTPNSTDDNSSDSSSDDSNIGSVHSYNDLPDDYDHSFDYTLIDEDGNQIFIPESELDGELVNRVYELLFAAADGNEDKYFEIFDIEEYTAAIYGISKNELSSDQCAAEKENQLYNFEELSYYLDGKITGRLRQINYVKSDYLSTPDCEVYYLSFVVPAKSYDLNVDATVYFSGGAMSVELELWSIVDHAYYDFEELIIKQMNAAASGDFDTYMECADPELYADVLATLLGEDGRISDDDIKELKDMQSEWCAMDYEYLNEALGTDFDCRILHVQQFYEFDLVEYQSDTAKLYGRILLTVIDSDGEYQEIEGYCYSMNGKKGVSLQPD